VHGLNGIQVLVDAASVALRPAGAERAAATRKVRVIKRVFEKCILVA
jgi:hypothetical protein